MNLVRPLDVWSKGGFRDEKKSQKSPHPNMWRLGRPGSDLGGGLVPSLICDGREVHVERGSESCSTFTHTIITKSRGYLRAVGGS